MEAKLIPLSGGTPIAIERDVTLVGRKRDVCDIYVERGSISKLHCVIVKTDGLLFFRDLGSTNGTKVNGQKVTRGALLPGDELAFASAKFRVYLGPGDPDLGQIERTEMLSDNSGSLEKSADGSAQESSEPASDDMSGNANLPDRLPNSSQMEMESDSDVRLAD